MRGAESVNVPATGRCDGCMVNTVNGVRCHEHGCPSAWREEVRECLWCGTAFVPESPLERFCSADCAQSLFV